MMTAGLAGARTERLAYTAYALLLVIRTSLADRVVPMVGKLGCEPAMQRVD
jgi:hypothetical protein